MFFKRIFRYRNNTFNQSSGMVFYKIALKFLRLKYPLMFAFAFTVMYDNIFFSHADAPKAH